MAAATFLSGFGLPAGALAAQKGVGSQPANVAGATNGIYHSPVLNYAVPQTFDGTSINWVSGDFDDSGPISGDWDLNFWASTSATKFDMTAVDDQGDEIAVTGTDVSLLQAGAVIGPALTFQDGDQTVSAAWLAGANGYMGFKFNCDGRLTNPVAGGVCYGYVHVSTTGPGGFPVTVVDYSYDGDGNSITIPGGSATHTVTPSVGTPSGTIAPATAQTVDDGATTSFTLAPASGFHTGTVSGTCGGNLAGNVYTTNAVTADCTVIANFVADGGGANGIYHSPVLNHGVPQTFDGTSINWVSGAFDDTGPVSAPGWDMNFFDNGDDPPDDSAFALFPVTGNGDAFVVDGDTIALLQSGATVGPSSTFDTGSTNGAAAWQAGADGYIGFKFTCNGRLANPVAGVCFGYVHVTTTGPQGFPATIVEYSYDGDGNPISIGPTETFTVTPSVGTPSGTITPATPQTVNSGATTSFTLAADAGFHVDTVGGTCGGTLAGNVYTTNAVTADCTVTANFAVGEALPIISATPTPVAIAVDAGASATGTLTVANTGGGTLTYSIAEAAAAKATSYLTAKRAHAHRKAAKPVQTSRLSGTPAAFRSQPVAKKIGSSVVLGDLDISQMLDNTVGNDGVGCGVNGDDGAPERTDDNSWWRRFYFSEHTGVGASANITSVTIGAGQNGGDTGVVIQDLPVTINLYTIAHSTPVDTIVTSALTLIGSGTGTISGGNITLTIPVTGAVDDTAGKDLVVEFHTDGNADGEGFLLPGANTTPETHPSFLSSEGCGVPDPTSTTELGFDDFHLVMIVSLGGGEPPLGCQNPSDVPWLSVTPATGSLAGGASADSIVTVDASTLAAGTHSANLCVTSNDVVNPLLTIPVNVTVGAAPPGDPCSAADTIFCDGFDGSGPPPGDVYDSGVISLDVPNNFDGVYINWPDGSNCTDGACGGNVNLYALDTDNTFHFFFPNNGTGDEGCVGDPEDNSCSILGSGDSVGPDSTFGRGGGDADTTNWQAGVDGFFGFEFECTGAVSGICYGYAHLTTTASLGFPATLVRYWYDTSGAAITIP